MIRKCRAMLIQIFDAADSNGLVLRNPARKTKTVRSKQNGFRGEHKEKDAFTEREVTRLIGALPDDLLGNSIRTLLCSGMRVQELLVYSPGIGRTVTYCPFAVESGRLVEQDQQSLL